MYMALFELPVVKELGNGGKYWENTYKDFSAKVYVPKYDKIADTINFGYVAPYLIVFEEKKMDINEAADFAEKTGLAKIASDFGSSVVFVYPTCEGGWEQADEKLFVSLVAESRINENYKDGYVSITNPFTREFYGNFIRGGVLRTNLYGYGASADYIAKNLMKKLEGEFLWGPGEITPVVCSLERLSVVPAPERRDIPVISVGNSDEINSKLKSSCDKLLIKSQAEYAKDYYSFGVHYYRILGDLFDDPTYEEMGINQDFGIETVKTSPDNIGKFKGTTEHEIGYVAYHNKGILENGPVPMLILFHGGGDSTFYITHNAGWYKVANKYGFLLVAVENHLFLTATEAVELIEKLKKKYNIDSKRIYASGFSMGGAKTWDMFQEYPEVFAALAPMDATFDVGLNTFGQPAPCEINSTIPVPIFYAGGEITPLPELPFQEPRVLGRTQQVFKVNKVKKPYDVKFEDKDNWVNKIWGIDGDIVEKIDDKSRGSVLTLNKFESEDGVYRTVYASISGQGHECRQHTCDHAWQFMSQFSR